MRRPMVAGNWKMNGSRKDAVALVGSLMQGIDGGSRVEVVLCPPYLLLPLVAEKLSSSQGIGWGGQNLDTHEKGAYTGEISGGMLRDVGCTYVIVGHSERRTLYGETNVLVAEKFGSAQKAGLVPILCVGETLEQRESNQTESIIAEQLDAVLHLHRIDGFKNAVVAYEPIWAIGTGRTPSTGEVREMHAHIRQCLTDLLGTAAAMQLRVLYGGSVNPRNAAALLAVEDVDGALIGGASLIAEDFRMIAQSCP